jgi:putative ABC transport system ATP-binding protein
MNVNGNGNGNGALLHVRDVHKSYRRGPEEVHALRGVSFELAVGEIVALVGPSGSGKTTLLNVLCGWEWPDEGDVRWADGSDTAADRRGWSEIGILPQSLGLVEELSVYENVELPSRLAGAGEKERIDELLATFGLDELADRAPSEVSLGEQQRAALARALLLRPKLILADEPTGHQDEGWAKKVLAGLGMAARDGTCCLIATHNQEAMKYAGRVLAIRDGLMQHRSREELEEGERPG